MELGRGVLVNQRTPASRRILVVDDEYTLRQLLRDALRSEGYEVTLAASGEIALELLGSTHFDAAVLDVNLPGIDGVQLHRRLRSRSQKLARHSIFISGARQPTDSHRYFTTQGAGFIEKPFTAASLRAAVRRMLQNGEQD